MAEAVCHTRYPILLVHGTGFRDWKGISYWGRIPRELEKRGARVFLGEQDGWGTVERNAAVLKERLESILAETGSPKVHVIAHSKGGLDVRYLVSTLGMASHVASVNLIAVPNRGSKTMDVICRLPRWALKLAGFFVNGWYRLVGDRRPDFCSTCFQFTTSWAERFNAQNPDADGVVYRSYAGAMSSFHSDFFLWWQNLVIGCVEGENDGLVTVKSARWTGFQKVWRGIKGRGVSHMDEVDFRRRPLKKGGESWDVVEEYVAMVAELKNLGL